MAGRSLGMASSQSRSSRLQRSHARWARGNHVLAGGGDRREVACTSPVAGAAKRSNRVSSPAPRSSPTAFGWRARKTDATGLSFFALSATLRRGWGRMKMVVVVVEGTDNLVSVASPRMGCAERCRGLPHSVSHKLSSSGGRSEVWFPSVRSSWSSDSAVRADGVDVTVPPGQGASPPEGGEAGGTCGRVSQQPEQASAGHRWVRCGRPTCCTRWIRWVLIVLCSRNSSAAISAWSVPPQKLRTLAPARKTARRARCRCRARSFSGKAASRGFE